MTDRGTKLDQAMDSLERAERALDRARGTVAEPDWRDHVMRAEARVMQLIHEGGETQ